MIYYLLQDTNDLPGLLVFFFQIIWGFAGIFGVCEFGERLRASFEGINDVCEQLSWYLFPYKTQQMLITLITVAQNSVELRVFGNISCGRITLKNV